MTERTDLRTVLHAAGAVLLVGVVLLFGVTAIPQVVGADHSYVVLSPSMRPMLEPGDVAIVDDVDPATIAAGDVITFELHGESTRTTHRVVEVVEQEGERFFRTKGDANEDPDRQLVPDDRVVGRVAFSIPYIGHVMLFANSRTGIVALLIVPAALLILNEILGLARAFTDADEQPETQPEELT